MREKRYRTVHTLAYIFMIILSAVLIFLTFVSIRKTEYFEIGLSNEVPSYANTHPLMSYIMLLLIFLLIVSGYRYGVWGKYCMQIMAVVVIWSAAVSVFFVFLFRAKPYADAMVCGQIAQNFNNGDFSALHPETGGDYLTIYPFQVGYIAFLQLIYRIAGNGNNIAMQLVNCAAACFIVYIMLDTVRFVSGNDDTGRNILGLSGVLLMMMIPLFLNVTYVYGDMIAWALALSSVDLAVRYLKCEKNKYMVVCGIILSLAIMLKSNEWIFLIAIDAALIARAAVHRKIKALLWAVYTVIMAIILTVALQAAYIHAADLKNFPKGAPKIGWVAMGMQDIPDGPMEFGWYNGYNRNLYVSCGYDYHKAQKAAMENICGSLTEYREHPAHGAYLFYRKLVSQWLEPAFGTQLKIEWQTHHVENLSEFAQSFIYGRLRNAVYVFLDAVHFIVLAGAAWFCLNKWKKAAAEIMLPLLTVFGGILFHMLWEAHCRYMLIYYIMLIPYAASGINMIYEKIIQLRAGRKRNEKVKNGN